MADARTPATCRLLVVDNYDSFVYTIVGYLRQMGAECDVVRNDEVPTAPRGYDGVVISPGPGSPTTAGRTLQVIESCADRVIPLFGVCLGLQSLGQAFGATVAHAPELMHGRTSRILHTGSGVFQGLPTPFTATRYHSLAVVPETVPDELVLTAWTDDGTVMGLAHRSLPLHSVQFHPESVLTENGHLLLANFLEMVDGRSALSRSAGLAPLVA